MQELEQKISKLLQEEQPITESEAQDLATLICSLPEINGGRVEAEVSPDFWRTFTRKLVNEYKTMCEEKSEDGFNGNSEYYLASVILEPIIDALIKTETELDNLAKNSA